MLKHFVLILFVLPNFLVGQHYFRLKADFSIKEKFQDGKMALNMGTVYYDKVIDKIIYKITFPEKETWVFKDTSFYRFKGITLISKQMLPFNPSATIFNNILNNTLHNFGLEKSLYKISKVEKDKDLVITTWLPDKKLEKAFGKVVTSKKDNKIYGIAFYSPTNELIKKQFFKNYIKAAGLDFPTEVTEIHYLSSGRELKVTIYKNVVINELKNDEIYNYNISNL